MKHRGVNKDIILRLREGDSSSIEELHDLYFSRLYSFSFAYLKSREDSLDTVQEVFIKLWIKRETVGDISTFDSFIFKITKNIIISLFRRRESDLKFRERLYFTSTSGVDNVDLNSLDYDELKEKYNQLLEKLPPKRREVFVMSREDGLKNREIAEELDISIKTVEYHISEALKMMRDAASTLSISVSILFLVY